MAERSERLRGQIRDGLRRLRLRAKQDVVAGYGGACVCCGETEIRFLTIDHIDKDGKKERAEKFKNSHVLYRWLIKNGFPKDRYRLMCMNCNWAIRYGNACPHQRPIHASSWNWTNGAENERKLLIQV